MFLRVQNTCLWVLLFAFGGGNAHAQSLTERGFPPCKLITHFSFELLSGGIMVVKANLDDFPDTLNFIMDTGSGGVSLDSTTAARLKLVSVLSDKLIHGIAGVKRVRYIYHQTLHFPGLTVPDLDFHTNDYTILSQVYGMQIDGIIGYSFLRRFVLEVDSDSLEMSVYTPGVFKYPSGGFMLKPDFTTIPIVQVAFRDDHRSNGTFYFDTGGGLCFLMSQRYATDSAIMDKKRKMVTAMAEGLGGSAQMSLTVVNAVHIGPYVFHKVPTYILDDRYNATAYPSVEGLIGNDLLRRFNLVINYPFMEIYLVPNSHFKDAFDYSYTGMNIYYIDGKIMIMEIEKGSPADEAGLQIGDELFGLENNFSHNIQVYKNLLENSDSKLRLLVMRNGQPRMLTLKPGRIY